MTTKLSAVCLGVVLALGCATTAPAPTQAQPAAQAAADGGTPQQAVAANARPKQVCVNEQVTGSRISRRVCRSEAAAEAEREAAQKQVREAEKVNRRMGQ